MNFKTYYHNAKVNFHKIEDATIAIRTFGEGKPLILIHGFIVHGCTWRKLLPELAKYFKCIVVDLPGFGSSIWTKETDFTFTAQAKRLALLFQKFGLISYDILAHDTGASIARMVAFQQPDQVNKLILINTEMPNHRPPYIPMHQFLAKLPGANFMFRSLLKMGFVVRSPLLLKQFYYDKSLLKKSENLDEYLIPLKKSNQKMFGMLKYLRGIEWDVIDGFRENHAKIKAKTLLVWGENDKTFPIGLAREMTKQFSFCELIAIQHASLMPHEERSQNVLKSILRFLEI